MTAAQQGTLATPPVAKQPPPPRQPLLRRCGVRSHDCLELIDDGVEIMRCAACDYDVCPGCTRTLDPAFASARHECPRGHPLRPYTYEPPGPRQGGFDLSAGRSSSSGYNA